MAKTSKLQKLSERADKLKRLRDKGNLSEKEKAEYYQEEKKLLGEIEGLPLSDQVKIGGSFLMNVLGIGK